MHNVTQNAVGVAGPEVIERSGGFLVPTAKEIGKPGSCLISGRRFTGAVRVCLVISQKISHIERVLHQHAAGENGIPAVGYAACGRRIIEEGIGEGFLGGPFGEG